MSTRALLPSIALSALAGAASAADGLTPPDGQSIWPQWQARITVSTTQLAPVSLSAWTDPAGANRHGLQSGALLGDFYFNAPGLRLPASLGGLRATGGLMTGARGLAQGFAPNALRGDARGWSALSATTPLGGEEANDTVPYFGIGYTGAALKGGWGVSADLGLVAENARLHTLFGNQALDSSLRELRLSPVLQVGVSYAF